MLKAHDVRFKADIRAAKSHVRFPPKADMCDAKANVCHAVQQNTVTPRQRRASTVSVPTSSTLTPPSRPWHNGTEQQFIAVHGRHLVDVELQPNSFNSGVSIRPRGWPQWGAHHRDAWRYVFVSEAI
jgi:hypothetical protein